MGNGVLNDHSLNLFRVSQSHAETDGPPVVLHEECVAIQMQLFRKVLRDFSGRIEGIRELLGIWPEGMTETGIVGRDVDIFRSG